MNIALPGSGAGLTSRQPRPAGEATQVDPGSERLTNPEAYRLRVSMGRKLDDAGITDPKVRKKMIEDALRSKGLLP